jgi:Arc/MetJ-type ribon-helix-helix transcriptional regulator
MMTVPVRFSGRTSLSVGWGLIKRFSEDIDFKVGMPETESRNRISMRTHEMKSTDFGPSMEGSEATEGIWPSAEEKAKNIAQAIALLEQAKAGGLRFSVYLPSDLADWLLKLVEHGIFLDPSEAVFVMLQEQQQLAPHQDLRRELLTRTLQAAIDDPRPAISSEEALKRMRKLLASSPEPAVWEKHKRQR